MCFTKRFVFTSEDTDKYINENILVARKPIKVFKVVRKLNKQGRFASLATNFRYDTGHHYYLKQPFAPFVSGYFNKICIEKGFHSWQWSQIKQRKSMVQCAVTLKMVECIIPEGSIYFQNEHGEIVSDNLIFTGKIIKPK